MKMQTMLLAAATLLTITATAASAQPYGQNGNQNQDSYGQSRTGDPNGYYSRADRTGYFDHDGNYFDMNGRRMQRDGRGNYVYADIRDNRQRGGQPYYQQGAYEQSCNRGNAAAGTIFGAIAGGLVGSAVSHGNGGAVVGGAVLGGLLGNTISKDISCDDQPYAFRTYSTGLNGDIGRRYDWSHGQSRGTFMPTREYQRGGVVCRDFTETTYRDGREQTRTGTSCRAQDGNWRFD